MRGFEFRWGLQPGDAQDRGQRRTGRGLQERQGARVADQAAMILRLVLCVGGSERRGLADGDGAEKEQRERVADAVRCPAPHGLPVYSLGLDVLWLAQVTGGRHEGELGAANTDWGISRTRGKAASKEIDGQSYGRRAA